MRVFLCVVFVLLTSCVTPRDIRELKFQQDLYKRTVSDQIALVNSGQKTQDEALSDVERAQRRYDQALDQKAEEVERRTQEAISAVKTGAVSLSELLLGGGGLTTVGMVALHLLRNASRQRELGQIKEKMRG